MYSYLSFWNHFNNSNKQQSLLLLLVYVQSPASATKQTTTTVAAAEMEGDRQWYSYATSLAAITDEIQNNVEDIQKKRSKRSPKAGNNKKQSVYG